jgi:hypothetical protein
MNCEQTRALAAELALGIADGGQRAQALRHLAECPDCRRAVQELTTVADELLMLAPEREPPAGFESRVLERLQPEPEPARPRRARLWRRVLVPVGAAAAAGLAAVAIALSATSDDRQLAQHYRATLAAAHGSSFDAARLYALGRVRAGVVYGYDGATSWVFVALYRPYRSSDYTVELVTNDARRIPLESLHLDPKTGSGGQAVPIDLDSVSAVRLIGPGRGDVLEAQLTHDQ